MNNDLDPTINSLDTVVSRVQLLLKESPELRNDDFKLYVEYIITFHDEEGYTMTTSIGYLAANGKYDLPAFETITRARRLIQSTHPELKAEPYVSAARKIYQEAFNDYFRENKDE